MAGQQTYPLYVTSIYAFIRKVGFFSWVIDFANSVASLLTVNNLLVKYRPGVHYIFL